MGARPGERRRALGAGALADPDAGAYTRLLRFDPGADSSPNGVQRHDFWEEVLIVSGDLTDLRLGRTVASIGPSGCSARSRWPRLRRPSPSRIAAGAQRPWRTSLPPNELIRSIAKE